MEKGVAYFEYLAFRQEWAFFKGCKSSVGLSASSIVISIFRSAKKLQFSTDEFDRDDDFQINNFSPNDEGPAAPLHIFEHHGIKKKLIIAPVDEAMMEEDCQESPPLVDNGTNKYFGGFTLVAPS